MTPQQKAFLDMIASSEIGEGLLSVSDNGYDVLVGSTFSHPLLFHSYADHPNVFNPVCNSTAAGRYQLLHRDFDAYAKQLGLPDVSPDSQDKIALQQIKECHALDDREVGNINAAIAKCSNIWASLPGNTYGQHMNNREDLLQAFVDAGGVLA